MKALRRSVGPGVGAALLVLLGSGIGWAFATKVRVRAPHPARSRGASRARGERHLLAFPLTHPGYSASRQRVQADGVLPPGVRPTPPLPEALLVIGAARPQPRSAPISRFTIRPPPPA